MSAEEAREEKLKAIWRNPLFRKVVIYAAVLLVVFLLGFIPMWLTARERARTLADAQRQLKLARMQNMLASAVIDARRAEYEPARQSASEFFTTLRSEMERADNSVLTQAQIESVRPLLAQRDELITLLARSDPASADRLSALYVSYRKTINSS